MITSKLRSDHPMLFPQGADMKFRTMAQTRNYVGDWFEHATAAASGAKRMRTDCNADICPDLIYAPGTYFESKAIGRSGTAIVYTHRAENDQRFVDGGNRLFYWLWNHRTAAGKIGTLYELRNALAGSVRSLAIVEFETLYSILQSFPQRTVNNKRVTPIGARLGYGTDTYKMGWSVRLNAILAALPAVYNNARINVYGEAVSVPIVRAARFEHFSFLHKTGLFAL